MIAFINNNQIPLSPFLIYHLFLFLFLFFFVFVCARLFLRVLALLRGLLNTHRMLRVTSSKGKK